MAYHQGGLCLWIGALLFVLPLSVTAESCHLDGETAYRRRVEAVKAQILSKLNLLEPPKVNFSDDHPALSSGIMRTYNAATRRRRRRSALDWEADSGDREHDEFYSKTVNLLDIRGEIVRGHHDHVAIALSDRHLRDKLTGNLSDVYKAELNFAFHPTTQEYDKDALTGSHFVRIEVIAQEEHPVTGVLRPKFVDGVEVDLGARDHIEFDVTRVVQGWLLQPCANNTCRLELHVHAMHRDESGAVQRFVNGIIRQGGMADAHILVMSHSPAANARRLRRRTKRQTLDKAYCSRRRGRNPKNCCLQDLSLNFRTDLGWNWVREPESFKPNHCSGACPYRWSSATAYSSVISIYNYINPMASAKPCCVADKLGSVILLFATGSLATEAKVERLSMMTVQTCKCS